jgi:hypothetical protein
MQFVTSRPDAVHSVCQRWLLKCWTHLRGRHTAPAWADLPVDDMSNQLDTLTFLDVVTDGAAPRFRIRFLGKRVAMSYGADFTGRFLDEAIPPAWRDNALITYQKAVTAQRPIYNRVDTQDRDGTCVRLERLLLPFTTGGGAVDRVLASIETMSFNGKFEQHDLGKSPHATSSCALVAVIDVEAQPRSFAPLAQPLT